MPQLAKGTPLSVRMARGRPNSRKACSKTGRAPPLHQALPGEEVARRAHRGPGRLGDLRMPRREPVEQLAGAPIRMVTPRRAEQLRDLGRHAVGTVVRGMAPIRQAPPSVLMVAGQPLVAGLAADVVPRAEFRRRVEPESIVGNKTGAPVHGW